VFAWQRCLQEPGRFPANIAEAGPVIEFGGCLGELFCRPYPGQFPFGEVLASDGQWTLTDPSMVLVSAGMLVRGR